jgi:Flp pilus assembly protein TadG
MGRNAPSAMSDHGERGATLIHTAIAMVALMAFSSLVIDYGIFWVARRQAQNSADAGALAGAMALAFDDPDDFAATGPAQQSAKAAAESNAVWGVTPNVQTNTDITFPSCPDFPSDTCVRVDVYRNVARSNPLPTFFGPLVGVNTQNVQATATARIISGTHSDCLRPWAVADKWEERIRCTDFKSNGECQGSWVANSTWDLTQTYDKYTKDGAPNPAVTAPGPDSYRAPGTNDPGTGFRLKNPDNTYADYGQFVQLKLGGGQNVVSPGWFLSLDMTNYWESNPDATPAPEPQALCTAGGCPNSSGAQLYEFAIKNCVGGTPGIGSWLKVETGNMTGPTGQGTYTATDSLYLRDPGASWDPATKQIVNSCAPGVCADGKYYAESPRIVPVSLFDLDRYYSSGYTGSNGYVQITNIFGYFILSRAQGISLAASYGLDTGNGTQNDQVYGIMVGAPGLTSGNSTIPPTSSFLLTISLVR